MLWWYPYGPELARVASWVGPALHAGSLWSRLRHQARLLGSRRFRGRVSLRALLKHADRLF